MLNVATVFSGIGAIEHGLERLGVPYQVKFACDNGNVDVWKNYTQEQRDEISADILATTDPVERKKKVDDLYATSRQTNFVEISYKANYEISNDHFHKDVTFLDGTPYKDEVDLFVGGSPCQSFSVAGKQLGLEDARGTLFYEFARLVEEIQPKVFIYENVKGLLSHDKGNTWEVIRNIFESLGYTYYFQVLTPTNHGIPQSRNRIFVVGFKDKLPFKFPESRPLTTTMKDYLMDNVEDKYYLSRKGTEFVIKDKNLKKKYTQINGDITLCQKANQQTNLQGDFVYEPNIPEKYFLSEKLIKYILAEGTKSYIVKPTIDTEIAKALVATMSKMHRANIDNYVTTEGRIRRLMPRECLRLMGFCDSFNIAVSDSQMYRQSGNSIVVDVLMDIFKEISVTMEHDEKFKIPNV